MNNSNRNQRLLSLCQRDLADYAANRKAEVDKGRETPELAGLLVQKYGYGMNQVLNHLADAEDSGRIGSVDVDAAVATINPDWTPQEAEKALMHYTQGSHFKVVTMWLFKRLFLGKNRCAV